MQQTPLKTLKPIKSINNSYEKKHGFQAGTAGHIKLIDDETTNKKGSGLEKTKPKSAEEKREEVIRFWV